MATHRPHGTPQLLRGARYPPKHTSPGWPLPSWAKKATACCLRMCSVSPNTVDFVRRNELARGANNKKLARWSKYLCGERLSRCSNGWGALWWAACGSAKDRHCADRNQVQKPRGACKCEGQGIAQV